MSIQNNDLKHLSDDHADGQQDGFVAGTLIAATAWGPWLAEVNQLLTALSLAVGVALGLTRLWLLFRGNGRRGN